MKKRILALTLGLCLALTLAACAPKTPAVTPTPDAVVSPTQSVAPAERQKVNLAVIKGPTGMGAVKLMADDEADTTQNDYDVTIALDNPEVAALITKGDVDIAAMASNVAASLYQKNKGDIQTIALGTLGVLYILEDGDSIAAMDDLAGRTLYATGQGANPEYVLRYLLEQNGLEMGGDVNVEWLPSDELAAKAAAGEAPLCMLPVPAATALLAKTADTADKTIPHFRQALDLTEEWKDLGSGSELIMTSVVVRKAFAEEHPEAVEAFLAEYAASINYVNQNIPEAAALVAQYGITPNAKIAEQAIPQANLVCITGAEMQPAIQTYYEVLFAADPKAVGGSLPDDGFYYAE